MSTDSIMPTHPGEVLMLEHLQPLDITQHRLEVDTGVLLANQRDCPRYSPASLFACRDAQATTLTGAHGNGLCLRCIHETREGGRHWSCACIETSAPPRLVWCARLCPSVSWRLAPHDGKRRGLPYAKAKLFIEPNRTRVGAENM